MIIGLLNRAGLVISLRGKAGGYMLAAPARDITVGSVLKTAEGSLAPVACLETKEISCSRAENCTTLPMWRGLAKVVDDYLEGITIEDLIIQQKNLLGNDYHI
jgi:Rrf2 family protein